ncbi:HAD family hydrolase [Butyrivibrio sp. INlla21]|uniref:HAD family hydrolase n=1 Tax=Butyrivibrio sp. INlla21 TaxID=1520811 RepID=UPI0008F06D0A|nr:HAD hydrolase-like protein [Butyrivibrio sp. INlla21]SFU99321.1 Predicted hydrolase, HAD superfamily [Butyrivibrio sp. INlla21]
MDLKLREAIDEHEYVSFDMFDTLIKRNVACPRDVFVLVQRRFEADYGIAIRNFCDKRISAEKQARSKNGNCEIAIDEIYENIEINGLSRQQIGIIRDIEEETEKSICCANMPVKEVYEYCVENNKKIIIVTDMYLSCDVLVSILVSHGYEKYDKLYVSSETKLRKRTGEMYEFVLSDLGIKGKELIHIGDSKKSDYIESRRHGIDSILITGQKTILRKSPKSIDRGISIDDSFIRAFVNNHLSEKDDEYYRFGYEVYGRLLLGFSKWLKSEVKKSGLKDIFFFSRDGLILKKAYECINDTNEVKIKYFYASRRALRLPFLAGDIKYDEYVDVLPRKKKLTVDEFFSNMGLDVHSYSELVDTYGVNENTIWSRNDLKSNVLAKEIYDKVKADVIAIAKKERTALLNYIKQEGLLGKVAVVDIGWRGTLQYLLQKIAEVEGLDINTFGYYVGLERGARSEIEAYGFFNSCLDADRECENWRYYTGLIENIFMSQEGSLQKYNIGSDGDVKLTMCDYEFSGDKTAIEQGEKIAKIQEGAIAFVQDVTNEHLSELMNISTIEAFYDLNLVGNHPDRSDIDMFDSFLFYDVKKEYLIKSGRISKLFIQPRAFIQDFKDSRWKIGFMKKALKISLPYYWIQKQIGH